MVEKSTNVWYRIFFSVVHEFSDFNFQCCVRLLVFFPLLLIRFVNIWQKSHTLRAGYQLLPSTDPFQFFFDEGKHLFTVFSQMACCNNSWTNAYNAKRSVKTQLIVCWPLPSSLRHYNRSKCLNVYIAHIMKKKKLLLTHTHTRISIVIYRT